jgi:drug/metabolite transporter (DMT)-like permease
MTTTIVAALLATVGFAAGDVFTALLARRVSGKASMLLLTVIKLLLYVPFILLWGSEFRHVDALTLAWSGLLGVLFLTAYLGFNYGMAEGKNPALVGVVAGCFPASATVAAIVFLGQRPTLQTIILLLAVLTGVICIGLPEGWRKSLQVDKGILLALIPLVCWGIFGALLNKPVQRIGTPHGWFVAQALIAIVMALGVGVLYNHHIPSLVRDTSKKKAWKLAIIAGIIIGLAEASQALALGSGQQIAIIEALLGSYPAAYFLIAHRVFHEPLIKRQWAGIGLVAVSIVLLSSSASQL